MGHGTKGVFIAARNDEEDNVAKYWFPAKRYGWGWGPPTAWQGWVVLIVFVGMIAAGGFLFLPNGNLSIYVAYVVVLTSALAGICWLKGEPPRWRWGDDERSHP
jgi:hypothetical protein